MNRYLFMALAWSLVAVAPIQAADTDLAGFRVYRETSDGANPYNEAVPLASVICTERSASTTCGGVPECTYTLTGISAGSWVFTVTAYNTAGVQSDHSNQATADVQ